MPGASLALFADLGACHVHKSSVTICVLPTPSGWRATRVASFRSCPPVFLSTPSGWRATTGNVTGVHTHWISIHALRVEGDKTLHTNLTTAKHFYPRPPGGGRLPYLPDHAADGRFLSTPSGWRATRRTRRTSRQYQDFYPRPPGGGRQNLSFLCWLTIYFYPRPPGGGRRSTA